MGRIEAISHLNNKLRPCAVWLLRIIVGATFIFSGFVKVIDPWGFVFKINEYLNVWSVDWVWREVVICVAVALSALEFILGVILITGCMRRSVCLGLALFMTFMLPLSAYVAIASPVADCGCFGEAYVISNTATFWKNVVLSAAIIYLLANNSKVKGLFSPLMQSTVIVASTMYCLVIAIIGMSIQPLMDFRPYKVGTSLAGSEDDILLLTYEKNGVEKDFSADELPDSTWRYIGRKSLESTKESDFAVFDGDDDVTTDVVTNEGIQVILVVSNPEYHQKARAGMVNSINDYVALHGGSMIGVVALSTDSLEFWKTKTHPNFDVYTSDDTTLKELARGDAALIYLEDGIIKWKRNIYSLPGDFPDFEEKHNVLEDVEAVDSGDMLWNITIIYLSVLAFVFILGLIRVHKANEKMKTVDKNIKIKNEN